ncbi:MAG: hypothetical protein C4520_06680 [Candidatus Abyssobacteria bacterium SURF_5]|uniref:Glycosyltransferase RgtA/B/C/D-like domain-containing protein n=1 Tax=Abyssobacteria bacterium (strain SURF_5) TaxID=2093360 RepID=A0A3A4P5I5_ABYX5|nr:MAG: hypothetical protein C4520_06680 [Candidatus Abyssubacteria bacterium SURF_5]
MKAEISPNSLTLRSSSFLKRHIHLLVIIASSLLFYLTISMIDLDFYRAFADLGSHMYVFERVLMGDVPYRDLWQNDTPGLFYAGAIALKLFGMNLYSMKLLLALVLTLSTAILFLIAKKIMPVPFAMAVAFVSVLWGNLILNIPYGGWFSNCFGLLALLAFLEYQETMKNNTLLLLLCGAALGMAFTFRQHIGLFYLIAVALLVAIAVLFFENWQVEAKPRSGYFKLLVFLSYAVLFVISAVLMPLVFLRRTMATTEGLSIKNFLVFFLPVFAFNLLIIMIFLRRIERDDTTTDYRRLFMLLLKREAGLGIGFLVPILPWYIHFSTIIGWKTFFQIITITHPEQQSFQQGYFQALRLPSLSAHSVLLAAVMCALCGAVILLLIFSGSRRMLCASIIAVASLLVMSYLMFFPLDSGFVPMYYLPVALEAVLFPIIYRRMYFQGDLLNEKEAAGILAIAVYGAFSYLSLIILVDRYHYQMLIFPWLAAAGYLLYIVHHKSSCSFRNAGYLGKTRQLAILTAASLPLLLLVVGKPLAIVMDQYQSNKAYSKSAFPAGGNVVFGKMEIERGGIYINAAFLEDIETVVSYLRENAAQGDYLFGGPAINMFNFLTGMPFPSRHRYFIFDAVSSRQQYEMAAALIEKKPKYYIYDHYYDTNPDPVIALEFFRQFPPIGEYVSSNYTFDYKIGRFYLYKRKDALKPSM